MGKTWGRLAAEKEPGNATLNITSLMDVMTIILIFLLFSFSSQDENLRLEKDLQLPMSTSEQPFKWAINVSLSMDQLKVEDEYVCTLKKGDFVGSGNDPDKIEPLFDRLLTFKNVEKYRDVDRDAADPVVIFHADKRHPFKTVYKVMKTAALAGYPNFRFAVLKN